MIYQLFLDIFREKVAKELNGTINDDDDDGVDDTTRADSVMGMT
jgi:hypothetical protein